MVFAVFKASFCTVSDAVSGMVMCVILIVGRKTVFSGFRRPRGG